VYQSVIAAGDHDSHCSEQQYGSRFPLLERFWRENHCKVYCVAGIGTYHLRPTFTPGISPRWTLAHAVLCLMPLEVA
jgi:hypothetical protein